MRGVETAAEGVVGWRSPIRCAARMPVPCRGRGRYVSSAEISPTHAPLSASHLWSAVQHEQEPLGEQQTNESAWQDGQLPPAAGQQMQSPPGLQVAQKLLGPQHAGVEPALANAQGTVPSGQMSAPGNGRQGPRFAPRDTSSRAAARSTTSRLPLKQTRTAARRFGRRRGLRWLAAAPSFPGSTPSAPAARPSTSPRREEAGCTEPRTSWSNR